MSVPQSPARPSRRSRARGAVGWHGRVGCLLVVLAGCSVSDYDKRYELAVRVHRLRSLFSKESERIADRRLVFDKPNVLTEDDFSGTAEWAKPPFPRGVPGCRGAYRGYVDAGDAKMPVTLAVGVFTDDDADLEKVKREVLAAVRENAAFSKAAWEDAKPTRFYSPTMLPWSKLRLTGRQMFDLVVAGNPEQKNIEGTVEIWASGHVEDKVVVVYVWRAPMEIQGKIQFDDIVPFSAGSTVTLHAGIGEGQDEITKQFRDWIGLARARNDPRAREAEASTLFHKGFVPGLFLGRGWVRDRRLTNQAVEPPPQDAVEEQLRKVSSGLATANIGINTNDEVFKNGFRAGVEYGFKLESEAPAAAVDPAPAPAAAAPAAAK